MSAYTMPIFTNAVPAPVWQQQGHKWNPKLHFTGDENSIKKQLTKKVPFPGDVAAYWLYQPYGGGDFWSLEVQMVK